MVIFMNDKILDISSITFQSMLTIAQTDEIFKLISLILTIISAIIVLARNIYEWYLKAKEDGKIDAKETKDLIDIVDKGVKDIKDNIKKGD